VNPESILVLCFNHRTMIELRQKIRSLAGNAAAQVTAMTFHGFAMRLTGRSLMDLSSQRQGTHEFSFDQYIEEAVAILEGKIKIPGVDEARETLTARYRYILVDEYQDIDDRQYRFITALTGRMETDVDAKIAIMAVGDDDQSIYGFRDANVRYIRRFKEDYRAETFFLMENYRSSHPIIETASSLIRLNQSRMKIGEPGRINASRKALALPPEKTPDESRVGLTVCDDLASQAVFVAERIGDLLRSPETRPEDIAVIARQGIAYPALVSLRMALAKKGTPLSYSLKSGPGFPVFRIREFQILLNFLKARRKESLTAGDLKKGVMDLISDTQGPWAAQVVRILEDWQDLAGDRAVAGAEDFTLSCLLEEKQAHRTGAGIFAGTVHSVKGMEFPHVFILDHGWTTGDLEEERRLYYVGMTRAMKSLSLCHIKGSDNPHIKALLDHPFVCRTKAPQEPIKGFSEDLTVTVLGMEDLFISFPARFPVSHPIHDRLSRVRTGDRVSLARSGPYIHILDADGNLIAALSKNAVQSWQNRLDHIVSARVLGMVVRYANDGENPVEDGAGPEEWLLPIVEILHRKTPKALTIH
jgi:ATP-dependent DNA helicase RecQ